MGGVAAAVLGYHRRHRLPHDNITDFLYLIGSVFAAHDRVQIADYFILKNDCEQSAVQR